MDDPQQVYAIAEHIKRPMCVWDKQEHRWLQCMGSCAKCFESRPLRNKWPQTINFFMKEMISDA